MLTQMHLKLSVADKERWARQAQARGVTLSELVRQAVEDSIAAPPPDSPLDRFRR